MTQDQLGPFYQTQPKKKGRKKMEDADVEIIEDRSGKVIKQVGKRNTNTVTREGEEQYIMGEEVTDFDIYNPKKSQKAPQSPSSNMWMNSPPEHEYHHSIATQS